MTLLQRFRTVLIFTKLSTKRFFRDKTALFFSILFPLIFLFVFGGLNSGGNDASFKVAVINQSDTAFSKSYVRQINKNKSFEVDTGATTLAKAKDKVSKSQIDGIILLPKDFGAAKAGQANPSGQIQVLYSHNSQSAGQTLTAILDSSAKEINTRYVNTEQPFSARAQELKQNSLSEFDYTFAGLVGFSIIGIGIFGPINVFPELKKQGILRRLHTTPIKVWQYFLATMFSQSIAGLISIAIQFAVAITIFDLSVNGDYFSIILFTVFSIFMILGIGLAIGGWAKNERQAAPLSNIIVFPMLFLSGTFFPRFLMPEWLQSITAFLPLTPVIDGLRLLTTEGRNIFEIGPQLGLIAAWLVIIYAVAFRVFKWE